MSKLNLNFFLISLMVLNSALAEMGVPIQLRLKSPTGDYPTASGVDFKLLVLSPSSFCILREENFFSQNVNNGNVALSLGSGVRGANDPNLSLNQVYDNSKSKTGLACVDANNQLVSSGQTYNPSPADQRIIRVITTIGSDTINVNFNMRATPYAIQAESVGGKAAADIIVKDLTTQLNQTNLNDLLFDITRFNNLKNVALSGQANSATNFTGSLVGDISGTQSSTQVDRIKGVPVSSTAPQAGEVLQFDGTQYVPATVSGASVTVGTTAGTVAAGDDARIVNALQNSAVASGDISGTFTSLVVDHVGGKTSSQISNSVADTLAATSGNVVNAIAKRDATGNISVTTLFSTNSSTNNVYFYDGANSIRMKAPLGLVSNYVLTLPNDAGASGQVLQTDGAGNLSWVNAGSGGGTVTSVTATPPLVSTGGTTPNISISQANSVNNGYLSSVDWNTFNSKQNALGYTPMDEAVFNNAVSAASCTTSQSLYWNSVSSQFMCQAISFPAAPVTSVAGKTGAVSLVAADISGLGSAALSNIGTTAGTVAAGDDSRIVNALQISSVFAGDIGGTAAATSVNKIKGIPVSASIPNNGDVLQFNGTQYVPVAIPSAPVTTVAGRTGNVTLTNADISGLGNSATLNVGTAAGTVAAGNDSRLAGALQSATFNGYIAAANCTSAQSMYWNSVSSQFMCQAISFPADAVSSVAGRTGAVVLSSTDISGLGSAAVLNVGAAAGNVVQLDGAARIPASTLPVEALTTSSSFGGDVSGTNSAISVDKLKGAPINATAPQAGQALIYNGTEWVPTTTPAFPFYARTMADEAFTATTPANVTSMLFSVNAGTVYRFKYHVLYTSSSSTIGLKLGLTFPAVTTVSAMANIPMNTDGTGAFFQGVINFSGDTVTATKTPAVGSVQYANIEGIIIPSASGSVQLTAGASGTATMTIKAGSSLEVIAMP